MAKFLCENDHLSVLERACRLKGSGFRINKQFLRLIEERRKQLYPIIRELRNQGNRLKLVKDRLYVNGKVYTGEEPITIRFRTKTKWIGAQEQTSGTHLQ